MPKCLVILCLLAVLSQAETAHADLAKGLAAAAAQHWPEALREFKPLAERGDANAQVNLGNLYMRGLGVEQDYGAAHDWYSKAARRGHVSGQAKLGLMYYYGLGVREDHAEALQWFLKAAEQGDPESALVLGELYNQGVGVTRQPMDAYLWYSIAADLGKRDAEAQRIKLLDELSPTDINTALTRLNVWRAQHEKIPPALSGNEPETALMKGPHRHKPGQPPKREPPSAKKTLTGKSSPAEGEQQRESGAVHSPK